MQAQSLVALEEEAAEVEGLLKEQLVAEVAVVAGEEHQQGCSTKITIMRQT